MKNNISQRGFELCTVVSTLSIQVITLRGTYKNTIIIFYIKL